MTTPLIFLQGITHEQFLNDMRKLLKEENSVATPHAPREVIGREELMRRLEISQSTEYKLRSSGRLPYTLVGKNIRYVWEEVVEALPRVDKRKRPV